MQKYFDLNKRVTKAWKNNGFPSFIVNGSLETFSETGDQKKGRVLEVRNLYILDETAERERVKKAIGEELDRFCEYVVVRPEQTTYPGKRYSNWGLSAPVLAQCPGS